MSPDRTRLGDGEERARPNGRRIVYCLIPGELVAELHDPLRRHFRDDPGVEVVIERRGRERRSSEERRSGEKAPAALERSAATPAVEERRRIRSASGRRVADRRAAVAPVEPPELPRRLRRHASRIRFVERVEPSTQEAEDADTARLVTRFQAGEREQPFTTIYRRYFDRVYGYLRTALRDAHEAEDAAQQVFARLFEALPDYERRRQPFRAWLFVLVRNEAISRLRKQGRLDLEDPEEIERHRELPANGANAPQPLDWISDRDLMLFVERLPLAQRQVLLLRYVLDLSNTQIASILGRTPTDVGKLHHRAVSFLRGRLAAVGRRTARRGDRAEWRRRVTRVQVLRARRFALARRR